MSRGATKWIAGSVATLFIPIIVSAANQMGHSMLAEDRQTSSQTKDLSIPFIVNQGQTDRRVAAYARTFGGTVFVTTDGEIVYSLPRMGREKRGVVLKERLRGAKVDELTWQGKSRARVSCFRGEDPSRWKNNLRAYEVVNFGEIYGGVELTLKAHSNNVEKLFFIKPGADPREISITVDGAEALRIDGDGKLEIETSQGRLSFTKPLAYQQVVGKRTYVDVAYDLKGECYGFKVGDYDRTRVLCIDPLLASTYLGGGGSEGGVEVHRFDVVVDDDGNVYLTGSTSSSDFPVMPGAHDDSLNGGYDVFVSKLDGELTALLASTFLGGGDQENHPFIALDDSGNVYLTGSTHSSDFPTISGAYDESYNGGYDVFVSRFSGDLTAMLASTFVGGDGEEQRPSLSLDDSGNVFLTGQTTNSTFPTVPGSFDTSYNGGISDFFVSKLDRNLTSLLASTFVGGVYHEWNPSVDLDDDGNVFLSGCTGSYDYPSTPEAYDPDFNGPPEPAELNLDVCISRFDNYLTTLLASTFIGTDGFEGFTAMCRDDSGNVYVTGHTTSQDYPSTPGALDQDFDGTHDYYLSKLDRNLSSLLASTFLTPNYGGMGYVWDMISDGQGSIHLTGLTGNQDFYTTSNAYDAIYNGGVYDAFLMKLDCNLASLFYSTFLGGSGEERGGSICADQAGNAYVMGYTSSGLDFPILPGGYDSDYNGGTSDCIVAKFTSDYFTRITQGDPIDDGGFSFGVSWIDYDDDGYLDLFVTNWWSPSERNYLYHNEGDGTFTKISSDPIVYEGGSLGSTWGHLDNDGDLDAFCVNPGYGSAGAPNYLYLNDGNGSFTKVHEGSIVSDVATSTTPSWADYDNDGDLDLFVGAHNFAICLYRNDGTGFTKMGNAEIGLTDDEGNGTWGDFDDDGGLDLLVTRPKLNTNSLFRNNGDGTFTELNDCVINQDSSIAGTWGDYDNDGDLDLFATYGRKQTNLLYENIGGGDFVKITGQDPVNDSGYWSGSSWGDCDNDGDLDLYVTGNYQYSPHLNALYENNGDGTFTKVTQGALVTDLESSAGAAWGDYDRDGDLDLFVANQNYGNNALYRNNGNINNWINIKCIGTNSNRSAIGAKVRLRAAIDGMPVWQLREISGQSGNHSQNSINAHFGLGDAPLVDSVKIEWPSGMVDVLTNVDINQFLVVTETLCGDANGDGEVGPGDVVFLLNYLYRSGLAPDPWWTGDANSDGTLGPGDAVYLLNYLFREGSPPYC